MITDAAVLAQGAAEDKCRQAERATAAAAAEKELLKKAEERLSGELATATEKLRQLEAALEATTKGAEMRELEAKREIIKLRSELRRTEEERDILKKAAAFFARGPD